ncbi:hypothetical protein BDW02DRAFT_566800 [Decorospora gaudefroyi]|uniref:Uncharacterized protein n=1 Tax=Decorospora gaudefroyi TaxID=184978 RepID=A0A6A5KHU6_9PLEO|nr:hypothetical protein BDW02DRAFT_566800 [Decorospora gaudefroyi]
MAQRHMCPSMGAIRRSLLADVVAAPKCSVRAFHSAAQRLEEQPGKASPAQPPNRKTRSAIALQQITSLQNRRNAPGGPARASAGRGQMAQRNPRAPAAVRTNEFGFLPEDDDVPTAAQPEPNARFARNTARPTTTHGSTPPPGQMVRANPSGLRITREKVGPAAPGRNAQGPNLRGRDRGQGQGGPGRGGPGRRGPRPDRPNNSAADRAPKKRERASGGEDSMETSTRDVPLEDTVEDHMAQQLLRLQRKEWDRVPYEPKYANGSFAASELIHAGRELFRGESAPVKIWGPLEKRIGVVGMYGAEAHLKIRRVGDGDAAPFGQEV